jgi:hypothetical protein
MITKNNLRLELSLNSSAIIRGQSIKIDVNLTNTLVGYSSVIRASGWPVSALSLPPFFISDCPPSASSYPLGIALYTGNYVLANISSGEPMHLTAPGTYYCSNTGNFSGYYFSPMSNRALLTPNDTTTLSVQAFKSVNGSWVVGGPPNYTPRFVLFPSGIYTVVEGDEWGDILFLYFQVS